MPILTAVSTLACFVWCKRKMAAIGSKESFLEVYKELAEQVAAAVEAEIAVPEATAWMKEVSYGFIFVQLFH